MFLELLESENRVLVDPNDVIEVILKLPGLFTLTERECSVCYASCLNALHSFKYNAIITIAKEMAGNKHFFDKIIVHYDQYVLNTTEDLKRDNNTLLSFLKLF